jgi:Pectate lyase superfamily protein
MSLTKVSFSMIEGAYINALDYGADKTGVLDSTSALQNAIDAAYGKTLFIPAGTYVHTGLNIHEGIMIVGEMPMSYQDVDTYTTINGGTTLWKKTSGDSLIIEATGYPSSYADSDFQVGLQNINFAGARYIGSSFTDDTVTTGHGIVVNAGDATESAIHLTLDNVFVFSMPRIGWRLSGQVYGCNAGWIGANFCGWSGFWYSAENFTNIGGEFYIAHYRGFKNGKNGVGDSNMAGVYLDQRGQSVVVGLMTSSNNYGPNFMSGRGGFEIQKLHCETQSGSPTSSPVVFGDGVNSTSPCRIDSLLIDPGASYANDVITFNAQAKQIIIGSVRIGDTGLVGNHVKFAINAEENAINYLWALEPVKISDLDGKNVVSTQLPAFNVRASSSQTNITGDSTIYTIQFNTKAFDVTGSFNTTTYKYTVPVTGLYDLCAQVFISGADGVSHNDFNTYIVTSTDTLARSLITGITPTGLSQSVSKKQFLQMGTQIYVQVQVSGGAKTVDITANAAINYFCGSLILPTTTAGDGWR